MTNTLKKHDLFKLEVNAESAYGRNILHCACFNENRDVLLTIITLLEETPEFLKVKLGKKDNHKSTPLLMAATTANVSVFRILLDTLKKT